MLWFLDIAARAGWCVDRYADAATGVMRKNDADKVAMTEVILILRSSSRASGCRTGSSSSASTTRRTTPALSPTR
jgi:hypothetical protein